MCLLLSIPVGSVKGVYTLFLRAAVQTKCLNRAMTKSNCTLKWFQKFCVKNWQEGATGVVGRRVRMLPPAVFQKTSRRVMKLDSRHAKLVYVGSKMRMCNKPLEQFKPWKGGVGWKYTFRFIHSKFSLNGCCVSGPADNDNAWTQTLKQEERSTNLPEKM